MPSPLSALLSVLLLVSSSDGDGPISSRWMPSLQPALLLGGQRPGDHDWSTDVIASLSDACEVEDGPISPLFAGVCQKLRNRADTQSLPRLHHSPPHGDDSSIPTMPADLSSQSWLDARHWKNAGGILPGGIGDRRRLPNGMVVPGVAAGSIPRHTHPAHILESDRQRRRSVGEQDALSSDVEVLNGGCSPWCSFTNNTMRCENLHYAAESFVDTASSSCIAALQSFTQTALIHLILVASWRRHPQPTELIMQTASFPLVASLQLSNVLNWEDGFLLARSFGSQLHCFYVLGHRSEHAVELTSDMLYGVQWWELTFSSCNITVVAPNAFLTLNNLSHLVINDNPLSTLDPAIFIGPRGTLESLSLTNLRLSSIDNLLQGMSKLTTLVLAGNHISQLPDGVFRDISLLHYLTLANNRIISIPRDTFANMPTLSQLSLADNAITRLDADIFEGVPQLMVLDLSNNSLSELLNGLLDPLGNLTFLIIPGNRILRFSDTVFQGLFSLRGLNIAENLLAHDLSTVLLPLSKLSNLNCSFNPSMTVGPTFSWNKFYSIDISGTSVQLTQDLCQPDAAIYLRSMLNSSASDFSRVLPHCLYHVRLFEVMQKRKHIGHQKICCLILILFV